MGSHCTSPQMVGIPDVPNARIAIKEAPLVMEKQRHQQHVELACADLEQCPLCLQDLASQTLGICVGTGGERVCSHYFHFACLRNVSPRRCPQCRASFSRSSILPDVQKDISAWARAITVGPHRTPTKRDVFAAYKAMLLVPPQNVEMVLDSWTGWARASDRISVKVLSSLARRMVQYLPPPPPPPPIVSESAEEEELAETPAANEGHHASGASGDVCSCGRIHAHRGDRVKRGPAWSYGDEDGGDGQLGTIARGDEGSEYVLVQWDRGLRGVMRRYSWPFDSSRHEVEHVQFHDVSDEVRILAEQTGFSSAGIDELYRRSGQRSIRTLTSRLAVSLSNGLSERQIRGVPKLFHRCRVLPDQAFVKEVFDACPPCLCASPSCRGGLRWNSQAGKHLGREGYVLKQDERDDTVLVEMAGRCNCKIWYPCLAVQPVFDVDMAKAPRFVAGESVECRCNGEWHEGTVVRVWWRPSGGWGNRPSAPYSIRLHDGRHVFAPRDDDAVIRKVDDRSIRLRLER
eukprot:TRINITY_DN69147_c0_g1_i1.p1 TRINITY_DN69147_c0_g1~~TRINITY_DN69147_c0_g1_i1.p1  ORF type:complete len:517 (+),score=55.39 TRINITY_DN69147_c0_g1_i1:219-1769(+)